MSGQFTRLPTDDSTAIRLNPYKHKKIFNQDEVNYQEEVYLTPQRPDVFKYIDTLFFKFELKSTPDATLVVISRRMADAFKDVRCKATVEIYSKNKEMSHCFEDIRCIFNLRSDALRENDIGGYQEYALELPSADIGHVRLQMMVTKIDAKDPDMYELTKELPAYGYTWIRCIGGHIRVHKKTLSHHIPYFKQLFTQYTNNYYIHVQLMDLCELIYFLPPFNRPITTGVTFGAFYRLSEYFKCYQLADICDNFMSSLIEVAPYTASFVAFEGGVESLSKKYLEIKNNPSKRLLMRTENYLRTVLYAKWNNFPQLAMDVLASMAPKKPDIQNRPYGAFL